MSTRLISMIIREKYIKIIREFYDSDLIKVITGVRRSGKSVILDTIKNEISLKSNNIIYLNFERLSDYEKAGSVSKLIDYVRNNRKQDKCYCFFDEVQEVENWQIALKDLRLDNCSIFVTGSNSKLLSSEFLTLLSGRFVSFRIRPFVYKEIMEYSKELNVNFDVNNYLIWGGFPGRFLYTSLDATKNYIYDLESTIIINDLIKRYKIKRDIIFKKIVNYVLSSNSRIFSARSVYNYIKNEDINVSTATIVKYMNYLKEAYIIDEIKQYSSKTKNELSFYCKIYCCDVCFNSIRITDNRFDLDHNMENIVYNELLYMGYTLKVFNYNGKEIDFIANKNGKTYYIQVAYSVVNEKAYKREFEVFSNLDNSNQKILITNDDFDYSTSTVRHIKLKDFLLMNEL